MDPLHYFALEQVDDDGHWRMRVTPELSSGMGALFGGCGLGAAMEILERHTGRNLVWATAQFLAFAPTGSDVDLEVTVAVGGHQVSQARVTARREGSEIFTVNAALGHRPLELTGSWALRPDVPPPDECPPRKFMDRHANTIMSRLDVRIASGRNLDELPGPQSTDGRSAMWVRLPDLPMSAAALGIVGDFVPGGISQALGQRAGGNSLDNTIRIAHRTPTEWVLADVRVHAIADGFGHGLVHLWGEDGTLLGTASQSTIVRFWKD